MNSIILIFAILAALLIKKFFFKKSSKCESSRVDGKTVVITGANTGIGLETAAELARRGARNIIMGCRDLEKGKRAIEIIQSEGNSELEVHLLSLDLASFESVRKFAFKVQSLTSKIHILVNNAGVMIGDDSSTVEGLEPHMGINHLGHFLLTKLLEKDLLKTAEDDGEVRIVNVSSDGHKFAFAKGLDVDNPRFGYSDWAFTGFARYHRMYGQSKLAQIYHAKELHRRFGHLGVVAVSLHPGVVKTEIMRYHQRGLGMIATFFLNLIVAIFGISPKEGAATTVHCCVAKNIRQFSGEFFTDCAKVDIFPWLNDERKQKLLWQKSEDLVNWKEN